MALLMIGGPIALGLLAWLIPGERVRPWFLPLGGAGHVAATLYALLHPGVATGSDWLVLDPPGRLVLATVSVLFLLCSFYAAGYLRSRPDRPNRMFCACVLALLGIMDLIVWSHHLGLMWVGIEATALVSAPLIYFNRTPQSIEATWKFLLIGSVGIALSLLGSFFLAYSSMHGGFQSTLLLEDLVRIAPHLSKPWLHAAFVLLLVGYGTKMGIAPMHTWKPDAYGEAPGVVGALLAGGVTNCAFLALLRIHQITTAAGESAFASRMLIALGLLSMAVAGAFMIGQRDLKRMLAYSSVEHMGILTLAIGLGGAATFGALLHMINNGMTKGITFLAVGNIHRAYESKSTEDVTGAIRRLPVSGTLFLLGFLAITGSPPFGPFLSEFTIFNGALGQGRYLIGGLFLAFLMLVFVGMGTSVLHAVQGRPSAEASASPYRESFLTAAPLLVFLALVLMLGVYLPAPLRQMLSDAARYVENRP